MSTLLAVARYAPLLGWALWLAVPTPARVRSRGESFARRNDAYVDAALVPAVDRVLVRQGRGTAVVLVVLVVAISVSSVARHGHLTMQLLVLPLVGVVVCVWAGLRLRSAGREFPVPVGRPTVARPRRAVLGDYVPASAQVVTWASTVLAVALATGAVLSWRRGGFDGSAAALGVLGAAVVVVVAGLARGFGRAMCERPQSALDACHLYLQDAWRAEALLRAHLVVCGTAFSLGQGLALTGDWPRGSQLGLSLVSALPAFALAYVAWSGRLHFRRRLWPTLAPAQVLLPGQSVPPRASTAVAA